MEAAVAGENVLSIRTGKPIKPDRFILATFDLIAAQIRWWNAYWGYWI